VPRENRWVIKIKGERKEGERKNDGLVKIEPYQI
jgi:hypothetical protein